MTQQLKKSLGLSQGLGILVSALLGTGVFVIPELTVNSYGSAALWGWGLLLFAILPVAFTFAQLGKHYPHAGGASYFVQLAWGPLQGRIVGWLFLALLPVGLSAAMDMAVWFLETLIPITHTSSFIAKLLILILMGYINLRGVKFSGNMQTLIACTVGGAIAGLATLATSGLLPSDPMPSREFNWTNVGAAAALAFWSFIGIEVLAHLSSEFKNPKRDFPIAIIGGALIVACIYWLGSWLTLHYAGGNLSGQPAMVYLFDQLLFEQLHLTYGAQVIGVFGLLSCIAAMNIYLASAARMAWSMAQDGMLPHFLKRLNSAGSPANAILVWVVISSVSISLTTLFHAGLEDMIQMANGIILLIYLLTMIAALTLLSGPQKLIPCVGASTCLVLMLSLQASVSYALMTYALLLLTGFITRRYRLKSCSV